MTTQELLTAQEWLHVVEEQQREIETLRQALPSSRSLQDIRGDGCHKNGSVANSNEHEHCSNSSYASSVLSAAFSTISALGDGDVVPVDSARYAKLCAKLERMQASLTEKSIKVRESRAKNRELCRQIRSMQQELAVLRPQVASLESQLSQECAAKADAVDKAATALLALDSQVAELERLRGVELRAQQTAKERDQVFTQLRDMQLNINEEVRTVRVKLRDAVNAKATLESEYFRLQERQQSEERLRVDLEQRHATIEGQASALRESAARQAQELVVNVEVIAKLDGERMRLQQALAQEQGQSSLHAVHLMQRVLQLESDIEKSHAAWRLATGEAGEAKELASMLNEELLQCRVQMASTDRQIHAQNESYAVLSRSYQVLVQQSRVLDASRRRMLAVFVPTKKRLSTIHAAMAQLYEELQCVSKTIAVGRHRCCGVGGMQREKSGRD